MSKLITVHESEWDKLEDENKQLEQRIVGLKMAADIGVERIDRCREALVEVERLNKLVDDISYTAKNRKEKMHLYRDALIEIGHWTPETQESAIESNAEGAMWRGCVAQANMALEEGGDAVDGRQRVYPDGYLERKNRQS